MAITRDQRPEARFRHWRFVIPLSFEFRHSSFVRRGEEIAKTRKSESTKQAIAVGRESGAGHLDSSRTFRVFVPSRFRDNPIICRTGGQGQRSEVRDQNARFRHWRLVIPSSFAFRPSSFVRRGEEIAKTRKSESTKQAIAVGREPGAGRLDSSRKFRVFVPSRFRDNPIICRTGGQGQRSEVGGRISSLGFRHFFVIWLSSFIIPSQLAQKIALTPANRNAIQTSTLPAAPPQSLPSLRSLTIHLPPRHASRA
jgi:hypothetical protein